MADLSGIIVRRATHSDVDGIKAIDRDLYDGNDGFLYFFHEHCTMNNAFPYLAELNGQTIAYTCGHVIEVGEVIVLREGRVKPSFQGQKVINKVHKGLIHAAMSAFPQLKTMTWASASPEASAKAIALHPDIKITSQMNILKTRTTSSNLKRLLHEETKESDYQIQALTKREALKLLTQEIRFLDYAPVSPLIGWQPSGWRVSTVAGNLQNTDVFITRCSKSNQIQAFCFVSSNTNDNGPKLEIVIYCDPKVNQTSMVIAYMLCTLKEIAALRFEPTLTLSFFFPETAHIGAVHRVLRDKLKVTDDELERLCAIILQDRLHDKQETKSKL